MERIVSDFLTAVRTPVSKRYVEKLILSHPEYPSLLSIVDTLQILGISHQVCRIDKSQLDEIGFPYLLTLSIGGGDIAAVRNRHDLEKNRWRLNYWNGVIVQVGGNKKIVNKTNNELYKEEKFIGSLKLTIGLVFLVFLIVPFINHFSWIDSFLLTISTIGACIGYYLADQETRSGVKSKMNCGTKSNVCDKILNWNLETIIHSVRLSTVVIIFFGFQTAMFYVSVLIPEVKTTVFWLLTMLSLLSIVVVGSSLYVQYFVVKAWCKWCLLVDGVLSAQTAFFAVLLSKREFEIFPSMLSSRVILMGSCIFLMIAICVILIQWTVFKSGRAQMAGINAQRIKNLSGTFLHLLTGQEKLDTSPFKTEMLVGSPLAPIRIIAALNPLCVPCREALASLEWLITLYPNQLNFSIRFSGNRNSNVCLHIFKYWLKYFHNNPDESTNTSHLLNQWFGKMDLEDFSSRFPVNFAEYDKDALLLEAQHREWIEYNKIIVTPTFIINGYQLPKHYKIEDLAYFVQDIQSQISGIGIRLKQKTIEIV